MTPIIAASGLHSLGTGWPLLTALILIPAASALIISLLPHDSVRAPRILGVTMAIVTGLLSVMLLLAFDGKSGQYQFVSAHQWFPTFGIQWKLGVDGISLFLILLTGLIFPIALMSAKFDGPRRGFYAWMLLLEAGCIGSFLALDLFLFFVFFEAVLVPMYFLIAEWGFARRSYAALKFFIYTFAGSAIMLIGIIALAVLSAHNTGRPISFDVTVLQNANGITSTEARWLFLAFAIAFAVKVPIFPFHTWSPDMYEQSPIAGAVVSTAVMVKLGTYGLIRFGIELFPKAAHDMAPLLLTLATIGMLYGAIVAAVQRDLRRLMAYSSLSNLGFIVLGIFALSPQGVSGAVLQMVNHGVTAGALFLLLGMIYARRKSTSLRDLRGLQKVAPILAGVFTVAMMSSIGVPGLNGFVGEFLILLGTFVTHRWWAVVAVSAVVLAALYLLWAYQQAFHGEPDADNATIVDLRWGERLMMAPLIAVIVFIGVYPKPLLDRIEPSVDRVLVSQPVPVTHSLNAAAVTEAGK